VIDLQAVYIRDIAELRAVDSIAMIRVQDVDVYGASTGSAIKNVHVNGTAAEHLVGGADRLFVGLPPNIPFESVTSITLFTASAELAPEIIEIAGGLRPNAPTGSERVTVDQSLVHVRGEEFDRTVTVLVNKQRREFSVVNAQNLIVSVPDGTTVIETVDVIKESTSASGESFFSYALGASKRFVTGEMKLVQQFVKALLTTKGTDIFDPNFGGDLQKWVGQQVNPGNPQALVAKTVLNIVLSVGAAFQARQFGSALPGNERLTSVEVLSVGVDPLDPTILELSLRLKTAANTRALFSLLLGSPDQMATAVG
jgi:hypothetical protein